MNRTSPYNRTMRACFIGYIVQAIVNNFAPLLFLTFQASYGIPLSHITLLVTVNFGLQLCVDLLSTKLVDKVGYRPCLVVAHLFAVLGIVCLTFLPGLLPDPFIGLLISVMLYAMGGGLLEVIISPVMEACPTDNKEKAMSMLHSFYCWGHMAVVLLSTLFFRVVGIAHWRVLAILWALVPLLNLVLFMKAPLAPVVEEGERPLSLRELCAKKLFWVLMIMMVCSGASEQAVSQWASTLAEKGLGVSKTVGDLAGPMGFAAMMGLSRLIYGKFGDRLNLDRFMYLSGGLCILSYLLISLTSLPIFGLIGCALCGFSVGIMWPGTFSKAASGIRGGGTSLFALLALAGDLGCSGGPTLVGFVTGALGDDLKLGVLAGIIFPILLIMGLMVLRRGALHTPKST